MLGKFKKADSNQSVMTRRRFVKAAGIAAALSGAGLNTALAETPAMPKVDEADPMAKALNYVHDAKTVDAAKRPSERFCSNCALYAGGADEQWAGCSIFPGKAVAGAGWCSAWAPKQAS